jgi:hypothetical protein
VTPAELRVVHHSEDIDRFAEQIAFYADRS